MVKLLTVLALALLILARTTPAFAADEAEAGKGPYPIWLSPFSPVESVDKIEEAWTRQFGEGVENRDEQYFKWTFYKGEGPGSKSTVAEDCETISNLEKHGYKVIKGLGRQVYDYQRNDCDFIEHLRHATPATVSYVGDVELTDRSVDILPAFLVGSISCELMCSYNEANRRVIPISRFWQLTEITSQGGNELHFKVRDTQHNVFVLAKGDFNGDGLEDLFVQSGFIYYAGSMVTGSANFILTRDQYGAVLRVVDPESHLCSATHPPFECRAEHSDLSHWLDAPR